MPQSFGSNFSIETMEGRALRALNLEPPRWRRMQQLAQQRTVNGRVLQPKPMFQEVDPSEAKAEKPTEENRAEAGRA